MSDPLVRLLTASRQRGFLGAGPAHSHVSHAMAYLRAVPAAPARALDLGAGGGPPGLVLAARAWPTASWCFVDANRRRTAFLREAVEELGLARRIEVLTERAEEVGRIDGHRGAYDVVVARSFGRPAVTAECAAPLLAPDGLLVVSDPPESNVSERWLEEGLAELGLGPARRLIAAAQPAGDGAITATLAVMARVGPCPDRYPRRSGIPAKRPLF